MPAASGKTFETINPATEERLAEVAHGEAEDIDRAVRAARRAFDYEGPWRRMSPSARGKLIWRIGDLIEEHADVLARLESLDNGKPVGIARVADVALSADMFRYMAGWPTKILGDTTPISAPGEYLSYVLRDPIGVVGQIIPWNFPLLMAAWKLAPALACGVTVVLKPAEQTPLSALYLGELLLEAGLPAGVVNIVTGFGDAGAALSGHPDVDKVAFTGSTEVGRLIVQARVRASAQEGLCSSSAGKSPERRLRRRRRHATGGHPRRGERDLLQPRPGAATPARGCTSRARRSTRSSRASPSEAKKHHGRQRPGPERRRWGR